MTTSPSSTDLGAPPPTQGPGWAPLPWMVWAITALVSLGVAAAVAGILWAPSGEGLPDAGALVVDGLPLLRLVALLAGATMLGAALHVLVMDPASPGPQGRPDRAAARGLRVAAIAAIVLAVASVVGALMALADVLGVPLQQAVDVQVMVTFLWYVEVSRALLLTAVLAGVVASALWQVRTLGAAAVWCGIGAVAVGVPSLTGHAAGLGSHSVALVSGFLHTVAASLWTGGVLSLAVSAALRDPALSGRIRRFGAVAIGSVAVLAVSGLASAAARMDSVGELVSTTYGRMVLVKIAALLAAGTAGLLVRRARTRGGGLRPARMLVELVPLGIALGVAVVLARTPFPREPVTLPSFGEELVGYPYPPAPTWQSVVLGWRADWVWLAAALVAVGAYVAGFVVLRSRGDGWPVGRLVSWVLGWSVIVWATNAGVAVYAPLSFSLHMVAHMALSMMAPILLVLGGPITLTLRALPPSGGPGRGLREWIVWALHTPVTKVLTHPAVVLLLYTAGLYGLYYTSFYADLMSSHLGHLAMQVHFLLVGYLFYWVVIGVDVAPRRLGYPAKLALLMGALVLHSFFAIPMMMTSTPMVPGWYTLVQAPWLTDALADSHVAGGIAWAFGEIPTLVVAFVLAVQWARSDDREARRKDRRAERDGDAELNDYNERLARLTVRPDDPQDHG